MGVGTDKEKIKSYGLKVLMNKCSMQLNTLMTWKNDTKLLGVSNNLFSNQSILNTPMFPLCDSQLCGNAV